VHEAKAITREEARYILLSHLISTAQYWADESRSPENKGKCSGAVFSFLVALDGGAMGPPGYEMIEDDVDFGGALHEHLGDYIRGNHVCEDDPARHRFMLEMVRVSEKYADADMPATQACQETLLEFLLVLDGEGDIPRPRIVPLGEAENIEYAKEEGFDYYPDVDTYDIGDKLHDDAHALILGEKNKPDGLYDFGDHLVDDAKRMGF
jgi:hypothetical protein